MSSGLQTFTDSVASLLARRLSRRGFLARSAIVGSAIATSGLDYVLRPGTAYASVCGTAASCADGYTAMCCTINHGVNQCPPGSFPGGWWKADGASLCGGRARYYIDCQAECTHCGCGGGAFCAEHCWSCRPHCADGECDKRRVCHNVFRYGQCDRDRGCAGPVMCRAISCTPPWEWLSCSATSATDESTVSHSSTCLAPWGPILARYTAMGSQGSVLGASVGGERPFHGGSVQDYQHGRMYYDQSVAAHWLTGGVLSKYEQLTGAVKHLGLPTSDLLARQGYHLADFQHGVVVQADGRQPRALWGPVARKWRDLHGPHGVLGLPTSDVEPSGQGSVAATFTDGDVVQQTGHAPRAVWGAVDRKWRNLAGADGVLGAPTSDVQSGPQHGSFATFEQGDIAQTDATGAHAVWGPSDDAWRGYNGVFGPLGYPTADVVTAADGSQECAFQHGTITYAAATGETTVVVD